MDKNSIQNQCINTSIVHRLFYERENLCPLCGNELKISVKVQTEHILSEEAYCKHCEMLTRSKEHSNN